MPRTARLLSAFLVVAALSTPVGFAKAARAQAKPRTSATSVTARLSELWGTLTHLWGEVGCGADPYGGNCTAGIPNTQNPNTDRSTTGRPSA